MSSNTENINGNEIENINEASGDNDKSPFPLNLLKFLEDGSYSRILPPSIRKRIYALKNLQRSTTELEAKFYEEVHLLECKYNRLYYPFHEKRQHIITGLQEPTPEECKWEGEEQEEEILKELQKKDEIEVNSNIIEDLQKASGIPLFWLTAMKNVTTIADMIQPHDEKILVHLIDIKSIILEKDPMGFVLEFHFSPNEFFSNSVLTKEYEMTCVPDSEDPFTFDGPEIVRCRGCKIDWKKDKNVTVKQVKKKQKNKKNSAQTRTVIKTVENESFFHFFNPPTLDSEEESPDYETNQQILALDFETGHLIRERLVPKSVLYFTGEASDGEYSEEDEYDGDEDMSDLEDESEDDEEKGSSKPTRKRVSTSAKNPPPECKQQ